MYVYTCDCIVSLSVVGTCIYYTVLTLHQSAVMPCKATLFNNNSDPIHDFGTGHRNLVQFNPHGNNILLQLHLTVSYYHSVYTCIRH